MLSRRLIDPVTGCWIYTGAKHRYGYGSMWDGRRCATVSRLGAEIYLGLPLDDPRYVCHSCDVPACFNPAHLFLSDAAGNWRDCWDKGRAHRLPPRTDSQAGDKNPMAKLTWEQVREIRTSYKRGEGSQAAIAKVYGVKQGLIWQIIHHKIWKEPSGLH